MTVTRVVPDSSLNKLSHKRVHIKRKSANPNKLISIYSFNTFDEFCEFCTYLNTSNLNVLIKKLKKSSLYLYNYKYYLSLSNTTLTLKDFKSLHCAITEFATYVIDSEIFERKLIEHSKTIIPSNAINTCIKHFA